MRGIVRHAEQAAMLAPWRTGAAVDDSNGTASGAGLGGGGGSSDCDPLDSDCLSGASQKFTPPPRNVPDVHGGEGGGPPGGMSPLHPGGGGGGGSATPSMGGGTPAGGGGGGSQGPAVPFTPSKGVQQWQTQVELGLQRNGLPANLAPQVMHQMQTESGGNPNAINNWDSNAKAGHPSQGLLQTIPGTFNQYHLPGDSSSITDPQANIDSAIGYAKSRYGPTLINQQGNGMGSGHGY